MPAESVRLQWKSTVVAHCQIGQQLLYRWVGYFQSLALVVFRCIPFMLGRAAVFITSCDGQKPEKVNYFNTLHSG